MTLHFKHREGENANAVQELCHKFLSGSMSLNTNDAF